MQRFVVKLLIYNELPILYFADFAMMSCFLWFLQSLSAPLGYPI